MWCWGPGFIKLSTCNIHQYPHPSTLALGKPESLWLGMFSSTDPNHWGDSFVTRMQSPRGLRRCFRGGMESRAWNVGPQQYSARCTQAVPTMSTRLVHVGTLNRSAAVGKTIFCIWYTSKATAEISPTDIPWQCIICLMCSGYYLHIKRARS